MLSVASLLLVGALSGRAFCAWVCPMSSLIELSDLIVSPAVSSACTSAPWATLYGFLSRASVLGAVSRATRRTRLLRPPGVTDEALFIQRCIRCLQPCPAQIIQATGLEAGA